MTKAWRSQHAHSPPAAGEPDYYYSEIGRKRIPANPEAFEEKLREGLKLSNWIKTRSMHTHRLFQTVAALLLAGTSLHAQTTQSTFAFGSEDWSLMSLPHAPETAGYTNPFAPALRTSL
ncbi:MAG: hypothetical protein NTW21_35275 [Verrucomicrobia bacterium]|nr:hypothetical protein [Verrucomicrobiota bacterium]